MAPGNLLNWANSVRANMASDSGRETFQLQVKTQGFLFLDDYLQNILSGTKQDPLIDLVKTPGRRKLISKKPKHAPKLGNPILFSLGTIADESEPLEKTDMPIVLAPSLESKESKKTTSATDQASSITQNLLNDTASASDEGKMTLDSTKSPPVNSTNEVPDRPAGTGVNLGKTMEVEEPASWGGMSQGISTANVASMQLSPPLQQPQPSPLSQGAQPQPQSLPARPASVAETVKVDEHKDDGNTGQESSFHSIPINSPHSEYHSARSNHAAPHSPTSIPAPLAVDESQPSESLKRKADDDHEARPPRPSHDQKTEHTSKVSEDVFDTQMPLRDEDATSKVPLVIPSLPDPMPLRKSTRAPSVGTVLLGGATPGPMGKRTSWLGRARSVNPVPPTVKKPTPAAPAATVDVQDILSSKTPKRKSADVEPTTSVLDQEPKTKVAKHESGNTPSSKVVQETRAAPAHVKVPVEPEAVSGPPQASPGVLDRLKKTVEGLIHKPVPKNESAVAQAIAEARAAAEARIAERNKEEGEPNSKMEVDSNPNPIPPMAVTDLFPSEGRIKEKGKAPEKHFQFSPMPKRVVQETAKASTATSTPPHSPPPATSSSFVAPSSIVFSKQTPVFVPPPSLLTSRPLPSPPPLKKWTFEPPSLLRQGGLGLSSSPFHNQKGTIPLASQSTMENSQSQPKPVFDDDDVPAWIPTTQDTDDTADGFETQHHGNAMICDEDDSWPVDEKISAGVQWTFGGGIQEDSMTWSTLPSKSQRGADTGTLGVEKTTLSLKNLTKDVEREGKVPGAFDFHLEEEKKRMIEAEQEMVMKQDKELEEIIMAGGGMKLVTQKTESYRPQSQMSMTSSSSVESQQQSQGFLNQASKLFSSALGTGSKKKVDVPKVLSKAAVAAKKQQEEEEKKLARLQDMELRRKMAAMKKAQEEKAKQAEEERKKKEEAERRKRERDEAAEKLRTVKHTPSKREDEPSSKPVESDRKPSGLKKTTSNTNLSKSQAKPVVKAPSTLPTKYGQASQSTAGSSKQTETSSKLPKFAPLPTTKGKAKVADDDLGQPSQLLHDQMAARAKAQLKAANRIEPPPPPPSESIELPDISSEYSNSDDEERNAKKGERPEWAQSPELTRALKDQSTVNPDDIFGPIRPLRMEEIFDGTNSKAIRYRPRASSNWNGSDRLTPAEERSYAKRMGYK